MIGCLIFGGLAAMGLSRAFQHRRCHAGWGGWRGWNGLGWHGHSHGLGHGHAHWRGFPGEPGPRDDWDGRGYGGGDGGGFDESDPSFVDDVWPGRQGGRGKRLFVRMLLNHVRATPAQERVIRGAFEEFRDEMKKAGGGEARRSRDELADALRRPTFDAVAMGEQFARHDSVIEGARKAYVGLVARIHDALEDDQRARLAELIQRGPGFGWWRRGF